jgi:hypothetical protein
MALVIPRDELQKRAVKYDLQAKPQAKPAAVDPVAGAIDRFSQALTQITKVNAAGNIAITELLDRLSQDIKAAAPQRPVSWTFHAKKDQAGNMTIKATPNY